MLKTESIHEIRTICADTENNHQQKERLKKVSFQNGGQKTNLHFLQKGSRDQNVKNHFPISFFNEIWLKVAECEYNPNFEIKFETNIPFKNGGQNKF